MVESPVPFIELRSEEVSELLARQPSWLLRWSTSLIFLTLVLIGLGAWLVHFPDIVLAPLTLTSVHAPKEVIARTDGKLVKLLTQEGALVASGATLAYLESTADHGEVLRLDQTLEHAWMLASKSNLEELSRLSLTNYHQLGELQNDYQTFVRAHIQLRAFFMNGFYAQKKALQVRELENLRALARNLTQQYQLQEHDMKLGREEYEVQQNLAAQKVIAALDLKREESKYMARKLPFQQTAAAMLENASAQHAKQKEILELDRSVAEQHDNFLQAISTLQSALRAWEAKYIVRTPISGKVHFAYRLQEGQPLSLQQVLFFVASPSSALEGEIQLPQQNLGKVRVGQQVLIKLSSYPYQEFGLVKGRIASIAEIPLKDNVFLAKVSLPAELTTTFGKHLTYRTGMTASAEIITQDRRLLERMFLQISALFNK